MRMSDAIIGRDELPTTSPLVQFQQRPLSTTQFPNLGCLNDTPFQRPFATHAPPPTHEKSSPFSSIPSLTRSKIVVFHLSSLDI
jgi:hypothetical protein